MKSLASAFVSLLQKVWKLLTEPFKPLPRAEDRRRAVIASAISLFSFLAVAADQLAGGKIPFAALVLLLVSYFLARTKWFGIAALILLITLSLPSFLFALTTPDPNSNGMVAGFAWLTLPLILSSLFYSIRTTIIYSATNTLFLLVLPLLRNELNFNVVGVVICFYILTSLFLIIVMVQRNEIENDRQRELIENRHQLSKEAAQRELFAEQAHRRAGELTMLNDIGRVVSSLQELEETLELIFDQVKSNIPLDLFFVALSDEGSEMVSFPILFDYGQRWNDQPVRLKQLPRISQAIRTGLPILSNRTEEEMKEVVNVILGDRSRVTASILMSPLIIGTRVAGVISAQSYTMNMYTEEDLKLLTAIAQQVAIAIENARLFEQTTKRAQRLAILNEIGREISTLSDLPTLMEKVYQQVNKALSADLFFIGLYNEEKNELSFPIMYDNGRRWEQAPSHVTDGTFSGKTILTRRPLLVNSWSDSVMEGEPAPIIVGDTARTTKSLLYVPMLFGNQTIGVISAQSYKLNAYAEEDLDLLSGIANQVVVAIQNARLLEETKQNAGYLSILNELGHVVAELRDQSSLLEVIYEQVKKHLSVDAFFVDLYHPESNMVSHPITYDNGARYHPGQEELNPDIFLHQFLNGDPAILILRREEELISPAHDDRMFGDEARKSASLMAAPIKVGDQVIGAISVQSYTLNAYTEDDLNLLVGIGNQIGIAVQNARLLEETTQNAGYLAILNELGRVVTELRDLPSLLEVIYEQVKKHLSVDAFYVGLYTPEQNAVSYPIMYDENVRYEPVPDELNEGSYLLGLMRGEPAKLILRTEQELAPALNEIGMIGNLSKKSASLMIAPLKVGEQVIGVISAQSYTLNAYTKDHLNLLVGIANQVSVAIENSRLYTSAQQEIKERLRAEMELQKERDFAVQVMNTLGQGVAVSLLDGIYEYINPAYASMLGYTPEEMIGKLSDSFVHPDDLEKLMKETSRRYIGEATTYEIRLLHKDGQIVHALITGVPRYANGKIIGAIAAITDLAERKRTEVERENLLAQMERKNAELERFTYTVSHDLKSPLVTIAGFLGVLESEIEKGNYDRINHTTSRIRGATQKMQRLLEELLELSRIGRIINPPVGIPFGELVSETLELVDGQLREKQVEVEVDVDLPIVRVDRVRMLEVIQNLIVNAIKFMGEQKNPMIHIGVETRDGRKVFFIKDNGTGIAPEFHDRIFGLFNKLDSRSDGTGIGLALVNRIIEVHGGKIWVQSEPGKGATFFFTLGE